MKNNNMVNNKPYVHNQKKKILCAPTPRSKKSFENIKLLEKKVEKLLNA
jgi:hypothetical protein